MNNSKKNDAEWAERSSRPCEYCGATPTWPVEWVRNGEDIEVVWLCAACDDREMDELDQELSGD